MKRLFLLAAIVLGLVSQAFAQPSVGLRIPAIFSDNMVLQRNMSVPVWGLAAPGEQITVSILDQKKTTTAGEDGKWLIKLDPMAAGGPINLTIAGKTTRTINNVMIGEVWVCSGQSNMEMAVRSTANAERVIANSRNPRLRHFTLQKATSDKPLDDCRGKWEEASPQATGNFTAAGYFFGLALQKELDVPIGLIHTSWGGTPIEVWMSMPFMQSDPDLAAGIETWRQQIERNKQAAAEHQKKVAAMREEYRKQVAQARAEGKPAPAQPKYPNGPWAPIWGPASLYNAMIAPIVHYGIAGAIWYQGESNAGQARLYRKQMPALIRHWRQEWGQGEFPFFIVSLANYMERKSEPSESAWAELREAQSMTAQTCPKTGQAIAIDIGDAKDIHPKDKKTVGERLALNALAIAYGKQIEYSGPVYDSMKIEGDKVRLSFKHLGGGLVAKDGKLTGFAIAGADRKFVWADATIDGDSIVVSSASVKSPASVRYAWADNPECNLYNKAGLPAVPFRTDDWQRGR